MRDAGKVLLFCAVIVVGIIAIVASHKADRAAINDYCAERGYTVTDIDQRHFNKGPYWYVDEDTRVYYVTAEDSDHLEHHFWMKSDFWRDFKEVD